MTKTQEADTLAQYDNPQAHKRVIVDMDFRVPKFTFEGPWTGRDIITVRANLHRAYRRRQMGLRKATESAQGAQDTQSVNP